MGSNKSAPFGDYQSVKSLVARRILTTLMTEFDRVLFFLSDQIGIEMTPALAEKLLINYIVAQGWRLNQASVDNLPWILLTSNPAIDLVGLNIKVTSPLYQQLSTLGNDDIWRSIAHTAQYQQLNGTLDLGSIKFVRCQHKQVICQQQLIDTIVFIVLDGEKIIWQQTLKLPTGGLIDYISKQAHQKQNQVLLRIARSFINPWLETKH